MTYSLEGNGFRKYISRWINSPCEVTYLIEMLLNDLRRALSFSWSSSGKSSVSSSECWADLSSNHGKCFPVWPAVDSKAALIFCSNTLNLWWIILLFVSDEHIESPFYEEQMSFHGQVTHETSKLQRLSIFYDSDLLIACWHLTGHWTVQTVREKVYLSPD